MNTLTANVEGICTVCRQGFIKRNTLQQVCGIACARRVPVIARNTIKAERKATKVALEKLKSRSKWMKEAQAEVNRYVRLRDHGKPCISCGSSPEQKFGGSMDCGHYLSRGGAPQLRFRLDNTAAQCVKCNRFLAGNAAKFRLGLIERIGLDRVETLEAMHQPAKFTVDYLKRVKRVFAKKANRMEKRIAAMQN